MNRRELRAAMSVSPGHTKCLHSLRPVSLPGIVVHVFASTRAAVRIEYELESLDEGGAYFTGEYEALDDALSAIEQWLEVPLAQWNAGVLPSSTGTNTTPIREAMATLEQAFRANLLSLPMGTSFRLAESYWTQLASPSLLPPA